MNRFTNNLCNNLVIVILLLSPITCGGYYYDDCFKEIENFDGYCTCEPNVLECSIGRVDFDSPLWTKFSRLGRIHNSTDNYSYSSVHLNVHKFDGVNVTYFPSVLFNNLAPSVKEITLTNWKFTSISSVIKPLGSSIKSLIIKNNYNFTEINHHRAFANLAPYLEHLDLSSNALIDIHKTAFRGLKYLREVILKDNNISFLPDLVFRESTKLANISLSSNSISILTKNTFAGLLSVEHLEIDSNKLFTIQNDTFRVMAKLRELDLSLNQINSLEPLAFRGLIAVETIYLSNNHLRFLPPELLSYCHALATIYLKNNLLSNLDDTFLKQLPKTFYLKGNQWTCNCNLIVYSKNLLSDNNMTECSISSDEFNKSSKPVQILDMTFESYIDHIGEKEKCISVANNIKEKRSHLTMASPSKGQLDAKFSLKQLIVINIFSTLFFFIKRL